MNPIRTQWSRLIRFLAAETLQVHIGQPIEPSLDVGLAAANSTPIKAFEIVGSALDPSARLTKKVLTVKQLLSPLSREQVGLVRCMGLNFADHAAETKIAKPTVPNMFYKPVTTLIGPLAPIVIPKHAQPPDKHLPDYEVELTVVIGKQAKNVKVEDALDYILGYTVGNDVSFRLHQGQVSQWDYSKGFDNTTPIGPVLVSTSLIPDPQSIPLSTVVNAHTLQNSTTANHIFTVAKAVSYLSQGTTLLPGSLIMTGTPAGVGYVRRPRVFLKHGDEVRVWAGSGIGTLVNHVIEDDH